MSTKRNTLHLHYKIMCVLCTSWTECIEISSDGIAYTWIRFSRIRDARFKNEYYLRSIIGVNEQMCISSAIKQTVNMSSSSIGRNCYSCVGILTHWELLFISMQYFNSFFSWKEFYNEMTVKNTCNNKNSNTEQFKRAER